MCEALKKRDAIAREQGRAEDIKRMLLSGKTPEQIECIVDSFHTTTREIETSPGAESL